MGLDALSGGAAGGEPDRESGSLERAVAPLWFGPPAPDGTRRMGLDPAWLEAAAIGEILSIDLPAPGTTAEPGDSVALIHTSSRMVDVRTPQRLQVIRLNDALRAAPGLALRSPLGTGWLADVQWPSEPAGP